MNDHYGGFDFDGFGTNGYGTSTSSVQQRYSGRGPTMESYDPSSMGSSVPAAGAYNSTSNGTTTHRTMLPSAGPLCGAPSTVNGLQHGNQLRGLTDFEPLPLSPNVLQRIGQSSLSHSSTSQLAKSRNSNAMVDISRRSLMGSAIADSAFSTGNVYQSSQRKRVAPRPASPETWLEELRLEVSGLSLEPMTGVDVVQRVETRLQQVVTRYLPCVDFLVQCQQELRKGLAAATSKRVVHHMFRDAMTPRQFYNTYIANLPGRFYEKNRKTMNPQDLDAAVEELQTLCANARGVERQGCEVIKNTFLGGMKDGESWGLRKWLSKHGGALSICNDSECILLSCQKLDRSLDSTRKLGERLRPIAKKVLTRLKAEVPSSYQEHSTAHPYLPFFHRLEAALKGMSNFDPEDDDVICIDDDDEVEELKAQKPPAKEEKKRKPGNQRANKETTAPSVPPTKKAKSDESSDDESFIEILDSINESKDRKADTPIDSTDDYMQELLKTFDDDASQNDFFGGDPDFDSITLTAGDKKTALELAAGIERLAAMFDSNQESLVRPRNIAPAPFWDEAKKYASALKLFSEILRTPDSTSCLEPINEDELIRMGNPPYSNLIRHPLCFREIVTALMEDSDDINQTLTSNNGLLVAQGLDGWNMWHGYDLLQAIDLVFLNALAYGKVIDDSKSSDRSKINKLRKILWAGIKQVIDNHIASFNQEEKRRCTPTRRGESSGFVVFKEK